MDTTDAGTHPFRRLFDRDLPVGSNPWLVLEGDWGGQIYLTVPRRLVGDVSGIEMLLSELNRIAWPCNDGEGACASLYDPMSYDQTADDGVCGGMGGGELTDGLWLHEEFDETVRARARELLRLQT